MSADLDGKDVQKIKEQIDNLWDMYKQQMESLGKLELMYGFKVPLHLVPFEVLPNNRRIQLALRCAKRENINYTKEFALQKGDKVLVFPSKQKATVIHQYTWTEGEEFFYGNVRLKYEDGTVGETNSWKCKKMIDKSKAV
jgi:signal peptidase I